MSICLRIVIISFPFLTLEGLTFSILPCSMLIIWITRYTSFFIYRFQSHLIFYNNSRVHSWQNDRGNYVNVFMNNLVSWNAAMARMARAEAFVNLGEPKIPVA